MTPSELLDDLLTSARIIKHHAERQKRHFKTGPFLRTSIALNSVTMDIDIAVHSAGEEINRLESVNTYD